MNKYVWKHFPGSEDWGLFPRGTKELEEDTAVVILSRINRYFPWSIYVRGNRDKTLEDNVPSDNLKDIQNYILSVINTIDKNVDMNDEKEETLTEAPDDDGIMSDDELDAQDEKERADFEARLKARRDKVAQQRADRDAKVARDAQLKAQAEEKLKEINNDWSFEHVFDVLVPNSGKCDTLAGEIIRAINKLEYRWFNDGDRFNEDYGIETCGQPALFLANIEVDDGEPFWDLIIDVDKNGDDDEYERMIDNLKAKAIELLKAHNELLALETTDMYDIKMRDVEEFLDDNDLVPKYDCDAEIPQELQAHLDKGNIDERDLIWEVQSWIENMGNSSNDVRVDWGNVYVYDLSKADYDELNGNLYKWLEDYASELTNEYGDPLEDEEDEEEQEEETDESLKEDQEEEKEVDDNETHGYANVENYERSQAILDEMSQLRKDEGEQESKLLKAWAQDKVIDDTEFTKKINKLHKEIQDKENALYKELTELHAKDKEMQKEEK